MANKQRDGARERFWRKVIKRQADSGLSVRVFCRRERLMEPSFYAWRRTIARRDGEGKPPNREKQVAAFVPVVVTDEPPRETGIVLEMRGGRRLRLPDAMTPERVAQLVRALETNTHAGEAGR